MKNTKKKIFVALCISCFLMGCATGKSYIDSDYEKGKKSYAHGDYLAAAEYYQAFIQDHPGSTLTEVAMYYLAQSYKEADRLEQAREVYQRLIRKYKTGFWVDSAKEKMKEIK